ncbi:MAG: cold shock domain-containing protein, partial [Nanoarchaeota archaeon]|nr:cold shock domain-containing protein [Nanoarchaeota archaeon]
DDEQDYFVHHTAIPKGIHLRENDRVSFEPADTERGKQARNISLLSGPEAAKPKKEEQYEEIQTEETEE